LRSDNGGIELRTEREIREMLSLYESKLKKSILMREEMKNIIHTLKWVLGEAD